MKCYKNNSRLLNKINGKFGEILLSYICQNHFYKQIIRGYLKIANQIEGKKQMLNTQKKF